jgi:hypothetical protein
LHCHHHILRGSGRVMRCHHAKSHIVEVFVIWAKQYNSAIAFTFWQNVVSTELPIAHT